MFIRSSLEITSNSSIKDSVILISHYVNEILLVHKNNTQIASSSLNWRLLAMTTMTYSILHISLETCRIYVADTECKGVCLIFAEALF